MLLQRFLAGWLAAVMFLFAPLAVAVPAIQQWRTANGVPVYFIPARELPMVDAQVLFRAGSARDGTQPGLARFTNALLEEGAGDWSADVIAERLDRVGARVSASSQRDAAVVALRSLVESRYLQPTVETVARMLKEPSFTPEAVERVRQQLLNALRERAQSPGAIAQDAFYQALYGTHPYGSLPGGTSDSLKAITRANLQAFHQRYYTAANAVVALVGDLDRAGAERLAEALVGGLPPGEAAPELPPVPPLTASQTRRIPHPSSQTHLLIGQIGVNRADPDYYALYLGNHVLGGNGLVSRLSQEIREKRGLAYGAYSALIPMRQAGPFLLNLQTRNDQADTALALAQAVVRDFGVNGPDPTALEEARQNLTGGFALDLAGNSKLVNMLGVIGFYGLPLDYLQTYIDRINGITLEQVRTAWQRHVQPKHWMTVIVGGGQPTTETPAAPETPSMTETPAAPAVAPETPPTPTTEIPAPPAPTPTTETPAPPTPVPATETPAPPAPATRAPPVAPAGA